MQEAGLPTCNPNILEPDLFFFSKRRIRILDGRIVIFRQNSEPNPDPGSRGGNNNLKYIPWKEYF